jgi:hypothetical protein
MTHETIRIRREKVIGTTPRLAIDQRETDNPIQRKSFPAILFLLFPVPLSFSRFPLDFHPTGDCSRQLSAFSFAALARCGSASLQFRIRNTSKPSNLAQSCRVIMIALGANYFR